MRGLETGEVEGSRVEGVPGRKNGKVGVLLGSHNHPRRESFICKSTQVEYVCVCDDDQTTRRKICSACLS